MTLNYKKSIYNRIKNYVIALVEYLSTYSNLCLQLIYNNTLYLYHNHFNSSVVT